MAGEQGWTIPTVAQEFFQASEKRLAMEERRPRVTKASDLMGPGLGPYAVNLEDPNSETGAFNGFWHLHAGAPNSPDPLKYWMGMTIATSEAGGVQVFWTYEGADAPHLTKMRGFEYAGDTRFYSNWQDLGGGGGGPATPTVQSGVVTIDPPSTAIPESAAVVFDTPFSVVPIIVTGISSLTTTVRRDQFTWTDNETVNGFDMFLQNVTNSTARDCTWMAMEPT